MPRQDPTIPQDQLPAGVDQCLTVAEWRLREALAILDTDRAPVTAAILFSFGVEEFGKAVLLHDGILTTQPAVEIAGFYDHHVKIQAAARYIPEENLVLAPGAYQESAFQGNAFQVERRVDFSARLSGLYVDWKSGWQHGVNVDPETLRRNIESVAGVISQTRQQWG